MPVHDYVCKDFARSFELFLTRSEQDNNIKCPKCDSKNVQQESATFFAVTSSC